MPSKQIYIKESDLPLFDEAAQYGESLSKVLSEALRQFVEKKRAEKDAEGNTEIDIIVGNLKKDIATTTLKFIGKLLATQHVIFDDGDASIGPESEDWAIYRTQKGKFLIYKKSSGITFDGGEMIEVPYEIAVHFIIDELPAAEDMSDFKINDQIIPTSLLKKAEQAVKGSKVEWLDI